MNISLSTAIESHFGGDAGLAVRLADQVLVGNHEDADGLHLLGVLRHQQGDHQRAIEFIRRAVKLRPTAFIFNANLAEAYRAAGKFAEAAAACRKALALEPNHPQVLCNLGLALAGMGLAADAAGMYRRALEAQPNFVPAHLNLGVALHAQGHSPQGAAHLRRAIELDPTSAAAHANLGQLLLETSQPELALDHCAQAVRLDQNSPVGHLNLANALRALGRAAEARERYAEALRLAPDFAVAHFNLGVLLASRGDSDQAVMHLREAVRLEPNCRRYWEQLARFYDERTRYDEAIDCWRRVCEIAPEDSGAHLAHANALRQEGRLAQAASACQAAILLEPRSAIARLNAGIVLEEQGAAGEAEAAYRLAIEIDPDCCAAHARLANLLRGKLPPPDQMALENLLASQPGGDGGARLHFAMSAVLDARREYAAAAAHVAQANHIVRQTSNYVPAEYEQFVNGLIAAFDRSFVERLADAGLETQRPVFVFGLPRSGTTLVEQILASHSSVTGAGELRLGRDAFAAIPRVLGGQGAPLERARDLDLASVRRLAARHLERLAAIDQESSERIVDKMPDNYNCLGLLAAMFPRATFIHCRRDLRDVGLSCWMTDFQTVRWSCDLDHIVHHFAQHRRLMDHWRGVLRVPMLEIDYEETVGDVEGVARRLLAACDLEWEPQCSQFHRTRRAVRTASSSQVRQPIYASSVDRWKNYEAQWGSFFQALAQLQQG